MANKLIIIAVLAVFSTTHMTFSILTSAAEPTKRRSQRVDDKKAFKCTELLARNRGEWSRMSTTEREAHNSCERFVIEWKNRSENGYYDKK